MSAIIDAFSRFNNIPSVSPKISGSNRLTNTITFPDPPTKGGGTRFYTSTPTGLDDIGFGAATLDATYNASGSFSRREIILVRGDPSVSPFYGDVIYDDYRDIAPVFTTAIAANTIRGGRGNQIEMTQLKRSYPEWNAHNDGVVQLWNEVVYRGNHNATPLPPQTYRFKMRLPANMLDVLAGNPNFEAWFENFGIKLDNPSLVTEARLALKTVISKNESGLRFKIVFDLFGTDLGGAPISGVLGLWYMQTAEGAAIPGHEYDVAIYFSPPQSNADLTGIVQVQIIDITDDIVVMSEQKTDVPMKGYANGEPRLIMWNGLYCGGFPDSGNIQIVYADNQVVRNDKLF